MVEIHAWDAVRASISEWPVPEVLFDPLPYPVEPLGFEYQEHDDRETKNRMFKRRELLA